MSSLHRYLIGDLGCLGIDVDKWLKENQAPLFPGMTNRWLLARTLRDNPSDAKVKNSLLDSMARWFPGGWVTDPWFETSEGGRQEGIDGIRIVNATRTLSTLKDAVKTSNDCTIIPTVEGSKGVLYVELVFNYRSQGDKIPWPVDTLQDIISDPIPLQSLQRCPDKADWILLAVGKPVQLAGEPKSNATIATELVLGPVGDAAASAVSTLFKPVLLPLWVGLAIWGYSKLKNR